MDKKLFKSYYRKMAIHGLLKALIFSSIFAFASLFISSLIFWLTDFKMFWLCFVIFGAVLLITTPIVYFVKYKPNDKLIAKKLDETGLEERMITMLELEGNDSFIARRQREDTLNTVKNVNASLLKFAISIPVVIGVAIVALFAIPMTVTAGLSSAGVFSSGKQIIEDITTETKIYKVSYQIVGAENVNAASIVGDAEQDVEEGRDAKTVTLSLRNGYILVSWLCDGKKVDESERYLISRTDKNIVSDHVFTAIIQKVDFDEDDDEEVRDLTKPSQNGEDNGNESDNPTQMGDPNNNNSNGNGSGGGAGAGKNDPSNQIIDNEQYYGDETYQNSKSDEMEKLKNNGVSDGDKDISSGYFESIKD